MYLLKKIFKFYLGSIALSIIYYLTVGGVLGWFATESGSITLIFIICSSTFLGLVVIERLFIKKIFSNSCLNYQDIRKFLFPYLILLVIFCVLFIINIFKTELFSQTILLQIIDTGMLKWLIAFLSPCAYIIIVVWGVFNFSYIAFYITAIVSSIIHIVSIYVIMSRTNNIRNTKKTGDGSLIDTN